VDVCLLSLGVAENGLIALCKHVKVWRFGIKSARVLEGHVASLQSLHQGKAKLWRNRAPRIEIVEVVFYSTTSVLKYKLF
jgi:hypothetical protein